MRHTRRGEAQVEYAIIGMVVSVCAVTTLLVTGAGGLRRIAKASELCVVEAGECDRAHQSEGDPEAKTDESTDPNAKSDDEDATNPDGTPKAKDKPEGAEDELLGPRVEKLNPDGTVKDGSSPKQDELAQLGPLQIPPPPPPADPFGLRSMFSSVLNTGYGQTLYQSFKGIFGLFF